MSPEQIRRARLSRPTGNWAKMGLSSLTFGKLRGLFKG
jgi:hypothetical protein